MTEDKDQHTKVAFTPIINGFSGVGSFLCEKLSKTVRMRDMLGLGARPLRF